MHRKANVTRYGTTSFPYAGIDERVSDECVHDMIHPQESLRNGPSHLSHPDKQMTITLVGYRGCGKSSVAPLLAERLGYACADSDAEIERRAGLSIAQIFECEQEAGFRQRETAVLKDLLAQQHLVVAAGGGAILAEENRQRMRAAGPVIWLTAPADVLAQRISQDNASASLRPSLTGRRITDEVAEVLNARKDLYAAAATLQIDASQQTPAEIVHQILAAIADRVHPSGDAS